MGEPTFEEREHRRKVIAASELAADHATYSLVFTKGERGLTRGGLRGEDLPCAYPATDEHDPEMCRADGCWTDGLATDGHTPEEWIAFWLQCVVSEAVHEALEHYQLDGKPLLDPHGPAEADIMEASYRLAQDLLDMIPELPSDEERADGGEGHGLPAIVAVVEPPAASGGAAPGGTDLVPGLGVIERDGHALRVRRDPDLPGGSPAQLD